MTTTTASTYRLLGHPAACPSWCTNGDLPNHRHDWYWTGETVVRDRDGPVSGPTWR